MFWLWLTLAVVVAILLTVSFTVVPEAQFAVVLRFRKRTGRVIGEGLHIIWPLIEQIERFSFELGSDPVDPNFVCKDDVEVFVKGSIQWRPDPDVTYKSPDGKEWVRFLEMSEDAITQGIIDVVKSELGKIAGLVPSDQFRSARAELEDLVNCVLRLSEPPHLYPTTTRYKDEEGAVIEFVDEIREDVVQEDGTKKRVKVRFVQDGVVPPERRIRFYRANREQIRKILDGEKDEVEDQSVIENRYGIDIEIFALATTDFTPSYKATIQKKQEAAAKVVAAERLGDQVLKLAEALRKDHPDLPMREAVNQAAATLGIATKKTISFEGSGGGPAPVVVVNPDSKGDG